MENSNEGFLRTEKPVRCIYHLQVKRSKSKLFRRKQYYSRIVVNGEVVWTGETVKNHRDCLDTITNLSNHMLIGSFVIEDLV